MEDQLAGLIAGAQRGDARCFEGLIDRFADRLYGYFYRLTGLHNDAEDLLQEVFLRLVQAIGRYEERDQFDAFLFRIATNLYRDRIRRSRRAGRGIQWVGDPEAMEEDASQAKAHGGVGVGAAPWVRLEQGELIDQMQEAMATLPDAEREVIALRHFSELSFAQIAAIMGTPLGTALARAHRGLAKLRAMLTGAADG